MDLGRFQESFRIASGQLGKNREGIGVFPPRSIRRGDRKDGAVVQAFGPITLGLTAASLAASAGGVWFSIRLAHRVGAIDVPNERSSHSVPTPRMGGVPMVAAGLLPFGSWALLADRK